MLDIASELGILSARRDPVQEEIADRKQALARAEAERDEAARAMAVEERAYAATLQELSAYERAVEQARSEVYSGLNAVTALMHAIERAVEGRERASQELERLDVEQEELRAEIERVLGEKERASAALKKSQEELESTRAALAGQASALASARIEREWRANEIRARERDLAASNARLASLEELDAARAGYGDAARALLASDDAGVRHEGSVADHIEVSSRYERAVEACLGELLQFVVVQDREDALRGLAYARERELGRCGFLVIGAGAQDVDPEAPAPVAGLVPLHQALQIRGPWAAVIRSMIGRAWIAESTDLALAAAGRTTDRVVTLAGEVFRGAHLVTGAGKETSRGILAVKREIKELRERQTTEHEGLQDLAGEVASLESRVAQVEQALAALDADVHRHEKSILGFELQATRGVEELDRLERRRDLMNSERRRAEEETATLRRREDDAQASILSLQSTQRDLDERLSLNQQQLVGGRDTQSSAASRVADAKAAHAALVERAVGVSQEVRRLVESANDLELRVAARHDDRQRAVDRRTQLEALIVAGHTQLDADVQRLTALKSEVSDADNLGSDLHADVLRQEQATRDARKELDGLRDVVSQSEVARATSEADLSHLSEACRETLQLSLEEVGAEVAALEAEGALPTDGAVLSADVDGEGEDAEEGAALADGAGLGEDAEAAMPVEVEAAPRVLSAEEAIAALKGKIDRLGPVNMMAIEQFDELESRHSFLTAQRKDLVDSIAATGDAIKRIEKTTRERFREAFEVINVNFERTFTTLFGGGRAGLILIDESDELESGIDIVAQPPGKRLQNVQLLSGGEKALTAMALMFAMFAYRPSPFCLLDEIDAPLDDANVGRFVEMLQGMQHHTQFILITHHRRTMEIADRLYGVTMEEPGVSKLISLKLN
jgi:chromosome segregation protein